MATEVPSQSTDLRTEAKAQHEEADAEDGNFLAHMESSRHGKFRECRLQIHISQQISIAPSSRSLPSCMEEKQSRLTMEEAQVTQMDALEMQSTAGHWRTRKLWRILLGVEGDFVHACRIGGGC